jgi:hypothetical protein
MNITKNSNVFKYWTYFTHLFNDIFPKTSSEQSSPQNVETVEMVKTSSVVGCVLSDRKLQTTDSQGNLHVSMNYLPVLSLLVVVLVLASASAGSPSG